MKNKILNLSFNIIGMLILGIIGFNVLNGKLQNYFDDPVTSFGFLFFASLLIILSFFNLFQEGRDLFNIVKIKNINKNLLSAELVQKLSSIGSKKKKTKKVNTRRLAKHE